MHDNGSKPAYPVEIRRLSTPREECLTLTIGSIDEGTVAEAKAKRFDQLPVLDHLGKLLGLVAREHIEVLLQEGGSLHATDSGLHLREIGDQYPLLSLLENFEEHRALVFRDPKRLSDGGWSNDWFAMVTISDLNRHPFRAYLYPIMADLETALAELIDRHFEDPWDWLSLLSDEAKVPLIGRWELEKRNSVDTSMIAGCTLTELIKVVHECDEIRDALGFKSSNQFKNFSGSFPGVRNSIMHPVRSLILVQEDVHKLRSRIDRILELTARTRALNADYVERGMVSQLLP